jgi:uncharacterized membrane protein YphA (DoxX/SURF4 family)
VTRPPATQEAAVSRPPRATFREALWEYLGHPADETPERRRILYAIVILRLGLGLMFLLRGWSAVFATPPDAFATRLGDPARWGLGGLATDTILFILGCTELGVGLLLIVGAFTRVSAVMGSLLLVAYLICGNFTSLDPCAQRTHCRTAFVYLDRLPLFMTALFCIFLGGLAVIVVSGSPFLSADRALDKLEEEERDHAPATLPTVSRFSIIFLRAGIAIGMLIFGLIMLAPMFTGFFAVQLFIDAMRYDTASLLPLACGALGVALAMLVCRPPWLLLSRGRSASVKVQKT